MAFSQISGTLPQYDKEAVAGSGPASGYVIKFYDTSDVAINMFSDSSGGGSLASAVLDSSGYPLNGSSDRFIPFVDQEYKIAFYSTQALADANTFASADWFIGPYTPFASISNESSANITALKAVTGQLDGEVVLIRGHTTEGDGGGGDFFFDSSSSATDDNGLTIQPDVGTGRWIRLDQNPVFSEYFGAAPTATAAVNSVAIQAAIDSNIGQVKTGPGTFAYDTDLDFDAAIVFSGASGCQDNGSPGTSTTKFDYTGTGIGMDVKGSASNGKENIHLRDFMLQGTVSATGGIALGTTTILTKSSLKNVCVKGFTNAGFEKGYGVRFAACLEMTFDNLYCQANTDGWVNYANDVATTLNFINSHSRSNSRYGLHATGTGATGNRQFASCNFWGILLESNADAGLNLFGSDVADLGFYGLHVENNNTASGLAPIILNGTAITKIISNITQASPGVVTTTTDHGYSAGELVEISGVSGMTEVNGLTFTVGPGTSTTFELLGVDTTSFTAYTSGGSAVVDRSCKDITFYSLKGSGSLGSTCFTPNNSGTATELRYLDLDFAKDIVLQDPTFLFQKKNNLNLTVNTFMEVTANTGTVTLNQTTQGNQIKALDTIANASNIKGNTLNRRTIVNGVSMKDITVTMVAGTSGTITLTTDNKLTKTLLGSNRVHITGKIIVDSVSSPVGTLSIAGIPVVDKLVAAKGVDSCASGFYYDNLTGGNNFIATADAGNSSITISEFTAGSIANAAGRVQATSEFTVNVTYFTDEVD